MKLAEHYGDKPPDELPHAVPAHPVELHAGLVPPPEDAQRAVLEHERLRIAEEDGDFDLLETYARWTREDRKRRRRHAPGADLAQIEAEIQEFRHVNGKRS